MRLHFIHPLLVQLFASVVGGAVDQSCDNSTDISGVWDVDQPFGVPLRGVYKQGYGYETLTNYWPDLVRNTVDIMTRDQEEIAEKYGPDSLEDLRHIIDNLRKMVTEVESNQPLKPLTLGHSKYDRDAQMWNKHLEMRRKIEGPNLSFYSTRSLMSGCYLLRRFTQEFVISKTLKNYDPYDKSKRTVFKTSIKSVALLARHTMRELNSSTGGWSDEAKSRELAKFLKLSLWANRFDLGANFDVANFNQVGDPVEQLNSFDEDLLIDDTRVVWDILNKPHGPNDRAIVDIVLDNAGYELFADLCLATVLVGRGLARKVRFHVKTMPWAISDATLRDFDWTVEQMRNSPDPDLKAFGDLCQLQLERGDWSIVVDPFWTTFYDFGSMKKQASALYKQLSEATLVIFKGELNYRKLVGDINYVYTSSLDAVLFFLGFRPSNVVTLRTVKSPMNIGLTPEKIRRWKKNKKQIDSGKYGVVLATSNASCVCTDNR